MTLNIMLETILETMFSSIVCILQIIFWCFIFFRMSKTNSLKKKSIYSITIGIGVFVYGIGNSSRICLWLGEGGLPSMLISVISVYFVLIENENKVTAILITAGSAAFFLMMCFSKYSFGIFLAAIVATMVILIFLVISILISYISRKFDIEYSTYEKAFLTGVLNWIIYMIAKNIMDDYHNEQFDMLIFVVLLASAIIVVIAVKIYENYNNRMQNQILHLSYEQNEISVGNIKKMYDDTSRMRHDIKNCLLVVNGYVKSQNYKALSEYLESYTQQQVTTGTIVYCNNQVINYIINSKFNICIQKNIQTKCIVSGMLDKIPEVDMSILLGNLLDNAIEATVMTEYPSISIEIYCNEIEISIIVDNTIKESVLKNNKSLSTIKKDKMNHGFGVVSIKNIAKKHQGIVEYSEIKNIFRCKVTMSCE